MPSSCALLGGFAIGARVALYGNITRTLVRPTSLSLSRDMTTSINNSQSLVCLNSWQTATV